MTSEQHDCRPVPLSYAPSPRAETEPEHLRPRAILLDVLLIFCVMIGSACFAEFCDAGAGLPLSMAVAVSISNLLTCTAGFAFSGLRAPSGNRWPHLAWVALGVWITGWFNLAIFGTMLSNGLQLGIVIAIAMGVGGAVSMLLKR